MEYPFKPIGTLHTCFKEKFGIPRQMNLVKNAPGTLVFHPEFAREEAVRELSGFSHIWLIFVFHKAVTNTWPAMVRPPRLAMAFAFTIAKVYFLSRQYNHLN